MPRYFNMFDFQAKSPATKQGQIEWAAIMATSAEMAYMRLKEQYGASVRPMEDYRITNIAGPSVIAISRSD